MASNLISNIAYVEGSVRSVKFAFTTPYALPREWQTCPPHFLVKIF